MLPVNHHKRALETFLVADAATALYNVAGSGNNLTDSNGNVILTANQLGFFSTAIFGPLAVNVAAPYGTLGASFTAAAAPSFALYQGTSESTTSASAQAVYPLSVRPYEKSESINAGTQVFVTKQIYRAPSFNTWTVSLPTGTGIVVPADLTEYQMAFSYRGRIIDEYFSSEAAAYDRFTFTTPDYTALGTVSKLDHLMQNMAYQADLNSRALNLGNSRRGNAPFIVLAVGTAGTAISGITAGSFVPVVNTASGIKGFNPTAEQVTSLQTAATASGFTHVVTIDILTAGAAALAKGMMILALDRILAFQDYVPQVKTKIIVSLPAGFDAGVSKVERVKADEGQGIGRVLNLQYLATDGQRRYTNRHTEAPIIEYPSPVSTTGKYNTYVIQHSHTASIGIAQNSVSPYKEIVLVPIANTTLSSASGVTGTLDLALNVWLLSNGSPAIAVIV